ncbi:hypothetical protein Ae201684P_002265 [Aphanomyces euteiches]|uniref:Uncharacterized protein n=1 Tax=Aphanomyces euteiches TaxID=100861 RepID=A0A6G0X4X8_9STRA|nr:hypothetical protein Ae201684_008456 [Aphanomyces euteiches]KAH9069890.1 hypothetical protein Ae201684P_002265 [Aphanomyces euteiches]
MDFRFLGRQTSRSEDNTTKPTTHPAFERPNIDASPSGAPPVPFGHSAPSPFGTSVSPVAPDDNIDELRHVRRTRSKSECLFLARSHSKNELPGPCQDYITQIQTIMAKNDPSRGSRATSTAPSPSSRGTSPTSATGPIRRNSVAGVPNSSV